MKRVVTVHNAKESPCTFHVLSKQEKAKGDQAQHAETTFLVVRSSAGAEAEEEPGWLLLPLIHF